MLEKIGAKFIYVLDLKNFEGRTTDNLLQVEDIAIGSAARSVAAYLCKHQFVSAGHAFQIKQERFVRRPREMTIFIDDHSDEPSQISMKGQVCKIANIHFV
ncbi:MAG: trans-2,3-dihydro-3-hydroxyanthranilate isomerase [Oleiphilaceae bacterium]|jgi:predicted PhzF superfamily epimerase YddE/YHI9